MMQDFRTAPLHSMCTIGVDDLSENHAISEDHNTFESITVNGESLVILVLSCHDLDMVRTRKCAFDASLCRMAKSLADVD